MLNQITNNFFENLRIDSVKENFSIFEIKCTCKDFEDIKRKLSNENYSILQENLGSFNYKWDIYIETFHYSISQNKFEELKLDNKEKNLSFQLIFKIHKEGNKVVIFDNEAFEKFISALELESILEIFALKKTLPQFIGEGFDIKNDLLNNSNQKISLQCNFGNYAQFPFSPEFFYINDTIPVYLDELFSKLSLAFCLIYIFDSSQIDGNKLSLSISGYKSLKFTLQYPNDINNSLLEHYYQIYDWIYSVPNNIEDKIGISRNILTAYLKTNSIDIDNSVFNSILSSNQIYVKGNISKYFEVKNKIISQIEQTVNNVNKSIDSFVANFQKSSFVFISYFLSVFIIKVINKSDLDKIFTKETSYIGVGFIMVSFLYLIVSIIIIFLEKRSLNRRYKNTKKRYEDILEKEDILKILDEDSEFKSEVKHLINRVTIYSIVWVLSLMVFTTVLFLASDFLQSTFQTIIQIIIIKIENIYKSFI